MGNVVPSSVDTEDVKATHDRITALESDVNWAVFKFDKGKVKTSSTGKDFKTFVAQFSDDEVAFAYYRLEFGVYILMVWLGEKSSATDKLAVTTATPFVLAILKTFVYQFVTSKLADVDLDRITKLVDKAKGVAGVH
ncbi:coactosin-like protein [Haliotis cracherodii]|uniref:coactosin-like protein n=1 Tax=Haliotis cracherodii TaxID=6455 RepID=UPI0039E9E022